MHSIIHALKEIFDQNRNAENASQMNAYMRNQFDFYGIKAPERKALAKQVILKTGIPNYNELTEVVQELWEAPQRELQYVAMELCDKYKRNYDKSFEFLIEFMVTNKSWWDTVDYIAATLAGNYLKKHPEKTLPLFKDWSFSENFWLVRLSIIFQLKYKDGVNTKLLTDVVLRNVHSNEFFIQKAIGWMLRQYGKYNPKWVIDFVEKHELKPLSKREAIRLIK